MLIQCKSKKFFILAKRLSDKEKEEIVKLFTDGTGIEELASYFKSTKLTINRNLKKILGEKKYKELSQKKTSYIPTDTENRKNISLENKNESDLTNSLGTSEDVNFQHTAFMEITPLNYEIEDSPQKDLASIPISDVQLPNVVYMIVDKNIELVIKDLNDYPEWNFLSHDELNRKTIEIFLDIKNAKRFCKKEQKVIKVPNTDVFRIVAPILISKGISRIVSPDKLIAL